MPHKKIRCAWCGIDPLYVAYHDREWGRPVKRDQTMFEMLLLEGFQAGLSWITILRKRENFRKALHGFDAERIARYGERDIKRLMNDPGIIRNRLKVESAVANAQAYLAFRREHGSFAAFLWSFTGGEILRQPLKRQSRTDPKPYSSHAVEMSKALKRLGFKFVGPTVCYAHMQASGIVDDHDERCFRAGTRPERRRKARKQFTPLRSV